METADELGSFLNQIGQPGVRGRLQARGQARALVRQDGVLPDGAPTFLSSIDTDLAELAFSLLRASLALREAGENSEAARTGFVRAGNALESLVQNGSPEEVSRGFSRVMGAAAYHLAGYSALAFSLMSQGDRVEPNFAPAEMAIIALIMRDLETLSRQARDWLLDPAHGDDALALMLAEEEGDPDEVVSIVVTSAVYRAFAFFHFALQTGEISLFEEAKSLLQRGLSITANAHAVSLWWIVRIAINLVDDLWQSSLHQVLPKIGPIGGKNYQHLRRLYIGELFSRRVSEVELWPSQIEAAKRSTDLSDDLVVALPTSAGKTRIAEIAALMALACGQRVLIITPLRALSAQTERSFRSTFSAMGFTISSLYGAGGIAGSDEDSLRTQDIVIATPEKLDFALRNDPAIINDIGLVVLDEGHLIGPSEREIRFENLVQRLLRRADSQSRRIVCLSAILPEGEQLNDLTSWIRSDVPGNPVQFGWRPTRQRFGTLSRTGISAKLNFDLETDGPYIPNFIEQAEAIAPRRTPFPKDNKELTLAAAWKFSALGKRTLIFCTQRDHVEGYATTVVGLHTRGFLPSLLRDVNKVARAVSIGREWLGEDHPAVRCLPLGVAIHHGRLPAPFLREVEMLLASGVLEVVIASPTLAQGLNLNAAVLLIPTLYRAGVPLSGEEFANVAGRAGRAFVDLDGLILHVMYEPKQWRRTQWINLVNSAKARSLGSGIISVVNEVMQRLAASGTFSRDDAMDYLANSQEAWFPTSEATDVEPIATLIEKLDGTVLGLIEALDANESDLPSLLDAALTGSLWSRQLARLATEAKGYQLWVIQARARLIWNKTTATQRRSQFAMGVGLESGLAIDAIANELTAHLDEADLAAMNGDATALTNALVAIGARLLKIPPFVPETEMPGNWGDILGAWIGGVDVSDIGIDNMRIIEEAFVYRLCWGAEAIRMKRRAEGGSSDYIEGSATACLEAGLPKNTMAILVRAGLPSRIAARTVINDTQPVFTTVSEMRVWLTSQEIEDRSKMDNWPTPEMSSIWRRFRVEALAAPTQRWNEQVWEIAIERPERSNPLHPARVCVDEAGGVSITSPDYRKISDVSQRLSDGQPSSWRVDLKEKGLPAIIKRIGRGTAQWQAI